MMESRSHEYKKPDGLVDKFVVKPSDVWPGHPYNLQVYTSVDYGKNFWYCGYGKFCKNLTEAFEFVNDWRR